VNPQVIVPPKRALSTRDVTILPVALRTLHTFVRSSRRARGRGAIPYYGQIMPILNEFLLQQELRRRDRARVAQEGGHRDLILDTLGVLELHGGPDAFTSSQHMAPTYQSARLPDRDE